MQTYIIAMNYRERTKGVITKVVQQSTSLSVTSSMINMLNNSILYYNTHMTMRQQDHKIKDSYFNFLAKYKILKLYLKNIHS